MTSPRRRAMPAVLALPLLSVLLASGFLWPLLARTAAAQGEGISGATANSLAERGKQILRELGCPVCHEIRGEVTTAPKEAPDLSREGEKVQPAWLFNFLREPHNLRPGLKARMANFRLTKREALALTEFIKTLRGPGEKGIALVGRAAVSAGRLAEGKKLFDLLDCAECHPAGGKKKDAKAEDLAPDLALAPRRLQPQWVLRWLKNPQAMQPGTKMPNFFYDEDGEKVMEEPDRKIRLLRDYIFSLGKRSNGEGYAKAKERFPNVGAAEGRQLEKELNCIGCHRIPGMPKPRKIAPVLSYAGSKFRREWLERFLREPKTLRPAGYVLGWRSRMPSFRLSKQEASALVAYLMSLPPPSSFEKAQRRKRLGRREKFRARRLFKKVYGCVGCHRIRRRGGKTAGGLSGPKLSHAGARLRSDFILNFIKNPRAFEPSGKMPIFGDFLPDRDARLLAGYLAGLK